jgi:hypothetical protein
MEKLSGDLLLSIFQKLDAVMLCRLSLVSKDFHNIADDDEVWRVAHGFTKGDSMDIVAKLVATVSDLDLKAVSAKQVTHDAAEMYFKVDPSKDGEESAALSNYVLSNDHLNFMLYKLDKAMLNLSIAYRMLHVPVCLRIATASALNEYYLACDKSYASNAVLLESVRDALKKTEGCVVSWEVERESKQRKLWPKRSDIHTAAFCCARSPWVIN